MKDKGGPAYIKSRAAFVVGQGPVFIVEFFVFRKTEL